MESYCFYEWLCIFEICTDYLGSLVVEIKSVYQLIQPAKITTYSPTKRIGRGLYSIMGSNPILSATSINLRPADSGRAFCIFRVRSAVFVVLKEFFDIQIQFFKDFC